LARQPSAPTAIKAEAFSGWPVIPRIWIARVSRWVLIEKKQRWPKESNLDQCLKAIRGRFDLEGSRIVREHVDEQGDDGAIVIHYEDARLIQRLPHSGWPPAAT
jgi:hypothetical protein